MTKFKKINLAHKELVGWYTRRSANKSREQGMVGEQLLRDNFTYFHNDRMKRCHAWH